jgi:hypothetical protein
MSPVTGILPGPEVFTVEGPLGRGGAAEFGAQVRAALKQMREAGVKPAALLVDTIFRSDGVASHPTGFLAARLKRFTRRVAYSSRMKSAGLFVGVQMESRELTARVVNGLRREGVLR